MRCPLGPSVALQVKEIVGSLILFASSEEQSVCKLLKVGKIRACLLLGRKLLTLIKWPSSNELADFKASKQNPKNHHHWNPQNC